MRWGFVLGIALAVDVVVFTACDSIERDATPRYYIPPDADDPDAKTTADVSSPEEEDDGASDAAVEVDADAGVIEAGPTLPLLATGSGFHPDPLVGSGDHTCVIAAADAGARGVWCWGANDRGQLGLGTTGDGTTVADVTTATRITVDETGLPFEDIDELALAGWHSCARRRDVLFCWGQRFSGAQAEPPSAIGPDRLRPRAIGNLDVARIAADGPNTCAAKQNGRHVCFGHSAFGQLGRASAGDPPCTAPIFYAYHDSAAHTCSGTLVEATTALPSLATVVAGEVHACALVGDRVRCWGTNLGGQLGRPGTQTAESIPQEVVTDPTLLTPLDGVEAIAAGGKHTCALRQGQVLCWGTNDAGQLGVDAGALPQRAFAAPVPGVTTATSIAVAERVSCAVLADRTVVCWGEDLSSLPDGGVIASTPAPVPVKGPGGVGLLGDVADVAPGHRHACARKTDASVWCWGKNDRGQLGDGTTVDSPFPVKVTGLPPD